jgi:hypothetical protein
MSAIGCGDGKGSLESARVPFVVAPYKKPVREGATDVLYLILFILVLSAAAIWLFFYLLQHEIFGPAARARRKAQVADQRAARAATRPAAATATRPAE